MIVTPAVGFFYGGLVRRKSLVSTIVQRLTIFAVVSLVWALWGYSEAFGPSVNRGLFGNSYLFGVEAFAIVVVATFAFFGSLFLLRIIDFTPVRVSGEEAYN